MICLFYICIIQDKFVIDGSYGRVGSLSDRLLQHIMKTYIVYEIIDPHDTAKGISMKHSLIRWAQSRLHIQNIVSGLKEEAGSFERFPCISNVQYGIQYPNSYLDIYYCDDRDTVHPLLFYVHGGGFVWGDKRSGDPGGTDDSFLWYIRRFLSEGFDFVSMNYAFSPDYGYPIPLLQMQEAICFLQDNKNRYDISTDRIVFAGASAGGQLIGQFANVQTNPEYARFMKMQPCLKEDQIAAILFNSTLFQTEKAGDTGTLWSNVLFKKCLQTYFDTKRLENDPVVISSGVLSYISDRFPSCFISDGNTASFPDQAKQVSSVLDVYGIRHVLNIYPASEKTLLHGFENIDDEYGRDNMDKMISFLHSLDLPSS